MKQTACYSLCVVARLSSVILQAYPVACDTVTVKHHNIPQKVSVFGVFSTMCVYQLIVYTRSVEHCRHTLYTLYVNALYVTLCVLQ